MREFLVTAPNCELLFFQFSLSNFAKFDDGSEDGTEFTLTKIGFKKILDVIASNIPEVSRNLDNSRLQRPSSDGDETTFIPMYPSEVERLFF